MANVNSDLAKQSSFVEVPMFSITYQTEKAYLLGLDGDAEKYKAWVPKSQTKIAPSGALLIREDIAGNKLAKLLEAAGKAQRAQN